MAKRIIALTAAFIIVFVCAFALTAPPDTYAYALDSADDSVICSLGINEISGYNECSLEEGNVITVTDLDPYITFEGLSGYVGSLVLRFGENTDGMFVRVYLDEGRDFNEGDSADSFMYAADTDCVIPVDSEVYALRIDIDEDFILETVELHTASAVTVEEKAAVVPAQITVAAVIAVIATALLFVLDWRLNILDKTGEFFKKTYKKLLALLASLAASAAVSALIQLIAGDALLSKISGMHGVYGFVIITGILFCIASLIVLRKDLADKPENAFLCLTLTVCIMMLIACPFGHTSWDTDSHYRMVLHASYIGEESYMTEAEKEIFGVGEETFPSKGTLTNAQRIEHFNEEYRYIYGRVSGITTIAHATGGLFLALGRLARFDFYRLTLISKLANILIYCFVCYFAIRRLKSGKMIAATVALIPTSLYLAANFSYDYWTNCFVILGMSYFVSVQQEKEGTISLRETIIMCASFVLASVPKLLYAVFSLLPFLIRRKKIDKPGRYYLICVASLAVIGILLVLRALQTLRGGGDTRGGTDVSTSGQIAFILGNPFGFAKMLLKFLADYLSIGRMKEFIVNFAYLGGGGGEYVFMALFAVTALTDKNKYDIHAYNLISRLAVVGIYVGLSAVIAAALYVSFTPVGYETVLGCQPRYLIPMLYPMLSIIGIGFDNKINRTFYNTAVLAACAAVNVYNVISVFLPMSAG